MVKNRNVGTKQSTDYIKKLIVDEAIRQGVDPALALAVAQHESGFNNVAVSPKNKDGSRDHGVFQLNDRYHKLNNVYDPIENIAYGIKHLKGLLAGTKGDVAKALSNYNAGAGAKGAARKQGDAYANKVMALMPQYGNQAVTNIASSQPIPQGMLDNQGVPIANSGNITGAAAGINPMDELGWGSQTPSTLYSQARQDVIDATKAAQGLAEGQTMTPERFQGSLEQQLMNRYFGATPEQLQTAYNQGMQNLQGAYNQIQNQGALTQQELQNRFENMRRLVNSDPRLQNQGYYIDPRDIESEARGNATLALMGLNPSNFTGATDLAKQRYEAQIANQAGVPYQDYMNAKLDNIKNLLGVDQLQLQALIDRANKGDTVAQQYLTAANNQATNYMNQLINVGKVDADYQKALAQEVIKGNIDLRKTGLQGVNAILNTAVGGQYALPSQVSSQRGDIIQTGINAQTTQRGQDISGMNQAAENAIKAQLAPSQIQENIAKAKQAQAFAQTYGYAGGLDPQQLSEYNYGMNLTPVQPVNNTNQNPLSQNELVKSLFGFNF